MGEDGVDAVYFDSREKEFVEKPKNRLMDAEGSRNNALYAMVGTALIPVVAAFIGYVPNIDSGVMNGQVAGYYLIVMAIAMTVVPALFVYWVLYGSMKHVGRAARSSVHEAIDSNSIWTNRFFFNKRFTVWKVLVFLFNDVVLVLLTVGGLYYACTQYFPLLFTGGAPDIGIGLVIPLSFVGLVPFALFLLLCLNNPIQWFGIAKKFEKSYVPVKAEKVEDEDE